MHFIAVRHIWLLNHKHTIYILHIEFSFACFPVQHNWCEYLSFCIADFGDFDQYESQDFLQKFALFPVVRTSFDMWAFSKLFIFISLIIPEMKSIWWTYEARIVLKKSTASYKQRECKCFPHCSLPGFCKPTEREGCAVPGLQPERFVLCVGVSRREGCVSNFWATTQRFCFYPKSRNLTLMWKWVWLPSSSVKSRWPKDSAVCCLKSLLM